MCYARAGLAPDGLRPVGGSDAGRRRQGPAGAGRPFLLGACPILSAGLVLGLAWSRNDLPPERTGRIQAASRRLVTARWLIGPLSSEGLSDNEGQSTGIAAPQAGQVVGGSSSAIPPQAWQTRRSQQTGSPPSSSASG